MAQQTYVTIESEYMRTIDVALSAAMPGMDL